MAGLVITGSCFSQERPDSVIFPDNLTGTSFIGCNLDNVFIPPGNIVEGSTQKRFEVQNDLNDWEVDGNNKPVRILHHRLLTKQGIELPDPKDIPRKKVKERIEHEKVV